MKYSLEISLICSLHFSLESVRKVSITSLIIVVVHVHTNATACNPSEGTPAKKHRKSRQDMTLFLQAVPSYISEVSWTLFSKIHFYLQIVLKTIKKKSHTFSEAHAIL